MNQLSLWIVNYSEKDYDISHSDFVQLNWDFNLKGLTFIKLLY